VFAIGGRGDYRIRGIHVDDLARLAIECGSRTEDTIIDAIGPERPTFNELVSEVRGAVDSRSVVIHVPSPVLTFLSHVMNLGLRDVLLTRDEYRAMVDGLADTEGPATGSTRLSEWILRNGDTLGRRYANELERHFREPAK
jgi:NADH dehydrogenase